jgi:predicted lipid-binding transport protein (Tim44 family)
MIKKIMSACFALALVLAPVSGTLIQDQPYSVSAKSYKSGKGSFNTTTPKSNIQNRQNQTNPATTNRATTGTNRGAGFGGSLMRGVLYGGIAGLLFGSLFANMGAFGGVLGLLVNIIAIIALFMILRKVFSYFTNKNKREDNNSWRK